MITPIGRRALLAGLGAASFATVAGAETPPTVLTVGRRTLDVNGRAASVYGITRADGGHGLTMSVADPFRVALRNESGVETLIHWHGLTPPFRQDGVPGISAPALAPGGTAYYDFPLTFPGTFWMHSHQGLQEQALMAAPLIIHDAVPAADEQEVVLMLHDFSFKSPDEIFAKLRRTTKTAGGSPGGMDMGSPKSGTMQGMDTAPMPKGKGGDVGPAGKTMDLNDVVYDAFLANDRTLADPEVVRVEPGGRVRLRVINGSAASNFFIQVPGAVATLVAVDGHAVQPMSGSVFPLAIAQRFDLLLRLPPGHTAIPVLAVLEGQRARTGIVLATADARIGKIAAMAETPTAAFDLTLEQRLRAASPPPARTPERRLVLDLTGSMQGYVWSLNGRVFGKDTPLRVAKGERVEVNMTNRTMMSHPMHLHGHVFQVVAVNGTRFSGAMRDTVLVPPMASVTIAFDADNPGIWAFHCHNLYHMAAGMMTTLQYQGV